MRLKAIKLEPVVLIAMLLFCSFYVGRTTMDYTITTRNLAWGICLAVIFFMITARALEGKVDLSILSRLIFPVYGLFFVISMLTLIKAVNKGEGWYEIARTGASIVSLFCFIIIIIENKKDFLIKTLVLISFGLCAHGMYQHFTITYGSRFGLMANMNLCSSAHLLLMPFCIYAIWRYSKLWKILAAVAVVTALFIILFSLRTRSTWAALLLITMAGTLRKPKTAICMVFIFVILGTAVYKVKGRTILNADSIRQRKDLWSQSMNMVRDNPLGVGAGNWRVNIPFYARYMSEKMRETAFKKIYFQRPHNDYVWVLAETGPIGLVLYLGLFGLTLYYAIKRNNVLVYSCLAGYMVIASFSFPKERTFHTIYLLLLMAMAAADYHMKKPVKWKLSRIYLSSVLIFAGLGFVLIVFGIRYRTEKNVYRAIVAKKTGDWKSVLDNTENISRFSTLDSFGTPLKYYQGTVHIMMKDINCALRDFQEAVKENPNHLGAMSQLGFCLTGHHRLKESQKVYEQIIELYPGLDFAENNLKAIKAVAMKGNVK